MDLSRVIKILNLNSFEDVKQIKAVFFELAHRYHPDKNPSLESEDRFREIVQAYEYAIGHLDDLVEHFGQIEQKPTSAYQKAISSDNLDDVFAEMFGFSPDGEGIGYLAPETLSLNLSEIFYGAKKSEKLKIYERCVTCHGQGAAWVERPKICRYCFGQGQISLDGDDANIVLKVHRKGYQLHGRVLRAAMVTVSS